jgi:hypothetical protein
MACRPTGHAEVEGAPSDDRGANGRVHFPAHADVDLTVGAVPGHPCVQAFAAVPIGSAPRTFGPAVNPSSDIDTSSTTLLIANLLRTLGDAVRHRQEIVGAGPAVSTSTEASPKQGPAFVVWTTAGRPSPL